MHDVKLLAATLDQVVMEFPSCAELRNLCADAGYKGVPAWNAVVSRNYRPNVKQRREEAHLKRSEPGYKLAVGWWNEPIPGSIASANY